VLLLLALSLLILPLRWLLAVLLAGAVHELGHYVALRLCGVNVSNLRIGIGGARMTVGDMGRWQ
jgi:membrane-associated protease RseP (regulator of RpoE activity)